MVLWFARWVVAVRDEKRDGLKAKAPYGNFCLKAGVLNILWARNPKRGGENLTRMIKIGTPGVTGSVKPLTLGFS